ncbi:MAG: L-glyceraldehyde 3-phosphate reductase [Balneolales bacterium]
MNTHPMNIPYKPQAERYQTMPYNRCGNSGLKLPAISLGLWHNFGGVDDLENSRSMLHRAFDLGINHFDLANNYGPPPGSAEETLGRILREDMGAWRDELIISSKAGYLMWDGPLGEWGSRKHIISSLDQSLKRMGLDYVDIFYHHRPDPETPMEETMGALAHIVRSGKALYAGISNYNPLQTQQAGRLLRDLGTPAIIHQPSCSMFNRWTEEGLLDVLEEEGMGCIAFSPLAQGLLTDKYLNGIPGNSRAASAHGFLQRDEVTDDKIRQIRKLNDLAAQRGQSLAQMALAWVLNLKNMTSVIIGASSPAQIDDNVACLQNRILSADELDQIESVLA